MSDEHNSKGNLHFVLLLVSLVIITWLYTLNQNRAHLEALKQFVHWLGKPKLTYAPLNLNGLLPAALGTVQMLFLGTVVTKALLPELEDKFATRLVSIALGFGFAGLMVILLGYLRLLYPTPLLLAFWTPIIICLVFDFHKKKLRAEGAYVRECLYLWKPAFKPTSFTWGWLPTTVILTIWLTIYYHAIMFPPLEVDSIIYHAPMASILFREHGLPFIAGGGVGIGSSANYPLLFSSLGAYYYLWIGSVQDLFLRIITPTMGILSVLATYSLGKEVGGRKLGIISSFLFSMVPAYLSYSSLATQGTTVTFFLTMGILFLVKAANKERKGYWITSGIFFGFALLTSYQALYFIPPLCVLLWYFSFRNRDVAWLSNIRRAFTLVFSMIIIGSAPYLRNWLVLGNPVYPFFNGLFDSQFISSWIHTYTVRDWNHVASYLATGKNASSMLEFISSFSTYPSFYPLNLLLILPATLMFLFSEVKMKSVILAFFFVPSLVIIFNQPSFIRYFWLTMPCASILVGWMFTRGFEVCDRIQYHSFVNPTKLFKAVLLVSLSGMIIFPSFVAVGGNAYSFIAPMWSGPDYTENYLRYTINPNMNTQSLLNLAHGSDALAWKWLSSNLEHGSKVATYETRIYYIRSADYKAVFPLDNMEAQDLYRMASPEEAISFLRRNHVEYVFVRMIDWEAELFNLLPLTKFLSSPQFPLVFDGGLSKIYKVGPFISDPILSPPAFAYIGPAGWSDVREIDSVVTRSVISGSTSPRLYVVASDLMELNIHYLDRGLGSLTINVHDPYSDRWIYNYGAIKKEDTEEWKCYELLVPVDMKRGFVELGLYAEGENFVISKIHVNRVEFEGKASLSSLEKARITNSTTPPSIMVYLPILSEGERLYVSSYSYGKKISVEVFEGYIPISMTTDWWLKHRMVARSPELPTFGAENPSLLWEAKEGIYTLVIVLWDEYEPDTKVDFSIAIGGGR